MLINLHIPNKYLNPNKPKLNPISPVYFSSIAHALSFNNTNF